MSGKSTQQVQKKVRKNSYAFCGGAYGDEGKGRLVDEIVMQAASRGKVVVYRDNGGANAGHTVEFTAKGKTHRIAFHQLPSGIFSHKATVILGKGMVLHPEDLLQELSEVKDVTGGKIPAKVAIDEMAVLTLDTHRAFESVLKAWVSGGKGSTGRGISPAYADILLRHPLRMRDLVGFDTAKIERHYDLYDALISGLGQEMSAVEVARLSGKTTTVGSKKQFLSALKKHARELKPLIQDVRDLLQMAWQDESIPFVFEKSQAVGLDYRWGVYPDVTASDTTFEGIFSASEGVVEPERIEYKAGVIKATYMSSVGIRQLPSVMEEKLAHQIREAAHEYGATTKRPRDIVYLDLPALSYFVKVGRISHLALTHMDIVYPDTPIKVCVGYTKNGKNVGYRPDQDFLNDVKPVYKEFKAWDQAEVQQAKKPNQLPKNAQVFLDAVSQALGVPVWVITTGPQRDQTVWFE